MLSILSRRLQCFGSLLASGAQDLLAAISALHAQGLHHLALSPESVWLRRDGAADLENKSSALLVPCSAG